jgi:hypothetical protein
MFEFPTIVKVGDVEEVVLGMFGLGHDLDGSNTYPGSEFTDDREGEATE